MGDQRALDLGGAEPMAGDIDDVVDAAGDPVIAVGVAPAAVAGEIFALVGGEVGLLEAREVFFTGSSPDCISARIAVGAV